MGRTRWRQRSPESNLQITFSQRALLDGVHAEAIVTTTHFGGIPGARETAVGELRCCATIVDLMTAVTFLGPLEASDRVTSIVAEVDTILHSHVRGTDIRGPCESSALNVIPGHDK